VGKSIKSVSLHFPLEPLPKDRHRSVAIRSRYGRPMVRNYSTKRNEAFERDLKRLCRFQMSKPLTSPIRVFVVFKLSKPKVGRPGSKMTLPSIPPDLDNLIKALFDGLNKVAWKDDGQVVQIHAQKVYNDEGKSGEIIVVIDPLEDSLSSLSGMEYKPKVSSKWNRRKTDKKKDD